jgi:hypothetical protein
VCSRHMGQPNQAREARQVTYDPREVVVTHPAYLSIEVSYRAGGARKTPQKSTHLRPPALTLQLLGTIALNVGHRGALKVQIRPLGVGTGGTKK